MGTTKFTYLPFSGGCSSRKFSSRLLTVVVYAGGQMTSRVAPVRLSSPIYCRPLVIRPRQDDLDVLDAARAVELGVGGALDGGAGGRGSRCGRGWGREGGGWGWGGSGVGVWGGVRDVTIRVAPSDRLQAFDDKPGGFLYLLISGEASKAESYRSVALIRAESYGAQHVRRLWNP